MSISTAFVGRQPIFLPNLDVYAYELLFRSGEDNRADIRDGDSATINVLLNTLTDVGLDVVAGTKLAFVNLTRNLLLNADFSCLPPEKMVLEILEDVEPDEEVIEAVSRLSGQGFTIALDDVVYDSKLDPLIQYADIVKLEFPQIPSDKLPQHISRLRDLGVGTILAEKLETHEEFELCKQHGCDLFQGYFFCRPQVLNHRKPECNLASIVRLVSKLQEPYASIDELEKVIQTDTSLSYKVLRLVNSIELGSSTKIESLAHAIVLLGIRRLRSMASMMMLASINEEKPKELINTAMVRAKMCELLAEKSGYDRPDRCFTIGLLSVMDAMLDLPMKDVIDLLPLSDEMNEALLRHEGQLGDMLGNVLSVEREPTQSDLSDVYTEAVHWTAQSDQHV